MKEVPAIVAAAAGRKQMHARLDLGEPGWTFWECRTLNLHRVVGLLRTAQNYDDVHALDAVLRGALMRNFTRAWWRGIAYGVVASVGTVRLAAEDLTVLVDAYENRKGTMQWVVLLSDDVHMATGVHTWIEGFLSPVYRSIVGDLSAHGWQVSSIMKQKDGVLKFLTAVADGQARVLTGRQAFPEFRDPFRTTDKQ
jgi:hypothetical protein